MKHAAMSFLVAATFAAVQQPPTVRTGIAGVVIDVTVLDKDGRPVTDLAAADFEIRDEGKAQQIISATLIRGGVPLPLPAGVAVAGATVPATSPSTMTASLSFLVPTTQTPTVTAMLFESLSADSRLYAAR